MPPGVRGRLRIFPEVFRGAHIAQQDPIAQRVHTCPRCGAEPGKSCWEKARVGLGRKTYLPGRTQSEPSWRTRKMPWL